MKKFITLITVVLSIAMASGLTSYPTQSVHASTLKRTYFPKSLRGNWRCGKYKLKITANTVTGTNFGNRKHTKIYKGSYYLNSHVKQTNKKMLLWKKYGYYYFSLFGSQPAKMKLHSNKILEVWLGNAPMYYHK